MTLGREIRAHNTMNSKELWLTSTQVRLSSGLYMHGITQGCG